ncbi:hypothetical protein [Neorhodopirellula pilleata]|uniref:hypothetical protein n=1 Tax=Neorhodopirellula pilleata TaxID=2714738 RepID=UPI0011B7FCFA|nr:hypothetical protein [Neorhodopirellula pilleata]
MPRLGCPHCDALLETLAPLTSNAQVECGACDRSFLSNEAIIPAFSPAPFSRDLPAGFGRGGKLDQVLLSAIEMLRSHVWALLVTSLFVNAVWFAVVGWPSNFLIGQWRFMLAGESTDLGSFAALMTATFAVGMMIAPMSAYAWIVMARLSLHICRYGTPRPVSVAAAVSHWKVPFRSVWQISVLFVALGVMFATIVVGGLVVTIALSLWTDPQSATLIGTLGMGTILIGGLFSMQWLLWPSLFLIADDRANLTTAVRWSVRLAREHRKLSLSLVTVYFLLATLGKLFFYVGEVVTIPIAIIPMAIGYLKMTGGEQAVDLVCIVTRSVRAC